jgi:hypothetical protein
VNGIELLEGIFAGAAESARRPNRGLQDRGGVGKYEEDEMKMPSRGTAYVEAWIPSHSDDTVSSVRIGGIGMRSIGKELRVKVLGRDGSSVLDALSWRIDSQISPDLSLAIPIPPESIGAVLIAIE